jgi:predicted RND superfamily exporter protein
LEAEMLAIQSAEIPQIENLLANINQLSVSVERFSQTAEQLPGLISAERAQIVQALNDQRPGLTSLAEQTEKALSAGTFMSEATNTTLKTFQDVVKQLEDSPSDPNSEPFKIENYTAAATQISTAVEHLTEFLAAFDNTTSPERVDGLTAKMDLLNKQVQATGKVVVDYAFNKLLLLGLMLMILGSITVLITCLIYWMLKKRFAVS